MEADGLLMELAAKAEATNYAISYIAIGPSKLIGREARCRIIDYVEGLSLVAFLDTMPGFYRGVVVRKYLLYFFLCLIFGFFSAATTIQSSSSSSSISSSSVSILLNPSPSQVSVFYILTHPSRAKA